mmetsp:Transcript_22583/g.43974  ORF Transcript_22583/g.43974 Transcript_22583/m.43974 type:complete len:324 (-) Transcript_22583:164-1135(-)
MAVTPAFTLLAHAAALAPRPLRRSLQGCCSAAFRHIRGLSNAGVAAALGGLPGFVMVDFDSTLTEGDTISLLTELRKSKCSKGEELDAYRSRVDKVVQHYVADRGNLDADEAATSDLELLLSEGEKIEHRSLDRVEGELLLEGLRREELRAVGSTAVTLQDSVNDFLLKAARFDVPVYVCSANWSKDLIIGALEKFSAVKAIESADLEFDERTGLSTGKIQRRIVSAFDKQRALRRRKEQHKGWSVYIGDGQPDCLGVLEADLGIVVGRSSSMRRALDLADEAELDSGWLHMPMDSATIDLGEDSQAWTTISRLIFPNDAVSS